MQMEALRGASGKFTVDTSGNLNTHAGKISTEGGSINTGAGDINTAGGQILTAGGAINTSGGAIIGGAITGTSLNTQGGYYWREHYGYRIEHPGRCNQQQ